jgi:hypothetical protein
MTELILSDVTVMAPGYCVIGLERLPSGAFRSVRPRPPSGFAWLNPFPHRRGESVLADLRPMAGVKQPHTEDHESRGLTKTCKTLAESDLVGALKQAEVAQSMEELFHCEVASQSSRGNCWIPSGQGCRSICGCEVENLRFKVFEAPDRATLRAWLVLRSGERLESLPVVDREWVACFHRLIESFKGGQAGLRTQISMNGALRDQLIESPWRFARIGLARGMQDGKCWLMLDSLFPQPQESWFGMLKGK